MDYQRIYNQIIERAKTRPRFEGYAEMHHVIPKCMGGTNDKDNIVRLTAREHYVCHILLTFIYPNDKKLFHAAFRIVNQRGPSGHQGYTKISSRMYEYLKRNKKHTEETKELLRNISLNMSVETRELMRLKKLGTKLTDEHKKHVGESIKKYWANLSDDKRKRPPHSEEHRKNISLSLKGRKHSEERKRKNSEAQKGKKKSEEAKMRMRGPKRRFSMNKESYKAKKVF